MPLRVEFYRTPTDSAPGTRFVLRSTADGPKSWQIPECRLVPDGKAPLVLKVESKVAGQPAVVAQRLEKAYPNQHLSKPLLIAKPRSIVGIVIPDAGLPLPAGVQCTLTVTVTYCDSDQYGNPTGPERVASGTCELTTDAILPEETAVVTVSPTTLVVGVGVETELQIEVRGGPADAVPALTLVHPDTVLAAGDPLAAGLAESVGSLREAVATALAARPRKLNESDRVRRFAVPIKVRADAALQAALDAVKQPLLIPVRTTLPGTPALPADSVLKLESAAHPFPGWIVIDFGTTNSTVTVHAPFKEDAPPGLPTEQRDWLQARLAAWLRLPAVEAVPPNGERFDRQWDELRREVAVQVEGTAATADTLADAVAADPVKLYKTVTKLELAVRPKAEAFRRRVHSQLQDLYHRALRVPSLRRRYLFPATLDRTRKLKTLASDMEVKAVYPPPTVPPVSVRMGPEVIADRQKSIGSAEGDLVAVLGRFFPSPKRYFDTARTEVTVTLDGTPQPVKVDALMQAGWAHLIERTDEARTQLREFGDGDKFGPFRQVVVTYPTVSPPSLRHRIRALVRGLGVSDVRTDYDEAVAAAIFYLMREYGAAADTGLESFKARSRPDGNGGWVQNLLVFDIGGGTTDVALINLTLTERTVFGEKEDRGAGGRFYTFRPKLLSSSGHMQLGGELMTLRLFYRLKAAMADQVLAAVQGGKLTAPTLTQLLTTRVPEEFQDAIGKFRPGELVKLFDQPNWEPGDDAGSRDARELAEAVLPTRWAAGPDADRANRLNAFYTLWDLAEEAKKKLGGRSDPAAPATVVPAFVIDAKKAAEVVALCVTGVTAADAEKAKLTVSLTVEQMEVVIGKVVKEAVGIARGTLEHLSGNTDRVDWLILSGQSCHLAAVDREIKAAFAERDLAGGDESGKFVWNPERVTFDPVYAKLATSIGACFAEEYRRRNVSPQGYKPDLLRGGNVLEYDINNLFRTLPCGLVLVRPGIKSLELFRAGQELREVDAGSADGTAREVDADRTRLAKARSRWDEPPVTATIQRKDYQAGSPYYWGQVDFQEILDKLDIPAIDWPVTARLQFEVDSRLDMAVLVYRTAPGQPYPHYRMTGSESRLPMADKLPAPAAPAAPPAPPVSPPVRGKSPIPPLQTPTFVEPFDADGRLIWGVAVSLSVLSTKIELFTVGQPLDHTFHLPDGKTVGGMLSGRRLEDGRWIAADEPAGLIEHFADDSPDAEPLVVWGRRAATDPWARLGTIPRPDGRPQFRRLCRFTLDASGVLRMHTGEPTYYTTDDSTVLKTQPGVVYRAALAQRPREMNDNRNPFTGAH